MAVSQGTYAPANAGRLALIENLAAEINLTSQASSMAKLSKMFSDSNRQQTRRMAHRPQAAIQLMGGTQEPESGVYSTGGKIGSTVPYCGTGPRQRGAVRKMCVYVAIG